MNVAMGNIKTLKTKDQRSSGPPAHADQQRIRRVEHRLQGGDREQMAAGARDTQHQHQRRMDRAAVPVRRTFFSTDFLRLATTR